MSAEKTTTTKDVTTTAETVEPTKDATITAEPTELTKDFPESDKKVVQLVYILQMIGFVFGLTFVAGVIVNFIKKGEIQSDIGQAHFSYQIRTFFWSAGWMFLSALLTVVVVGYITMAIAFFWTLYRVIKGFMRMNSGKPV